MTMDERVEAGTRAYNAAEYGSDSDHVRLILAAAFPELHGDQPKGWIAPSTPTNEMLDPFVERGLGRANSRLIWYEAMRAYLGKGDGG